MINMASPEDDELSRAVSSLDLNEALTASQNERKGPRYSKDELLSLQPEIEKHPEHVEVAEIGSDGVMTPPSQACPRPPPPTPEDANKVAAASNGEDVMAADNVELVAGEEPKNKKKSKGSGKNKKAPATGFEEFYADPPVTPDEYDEECDLYDISRPFHQRIETCIQRYRARRHLDSIRSNILTRYFMLGGIEAGTKMFTGGPDKETLDNSTAKEIEAIQATDHVRSGNKKYYDPSDSENWVVDFEGVAKGFFSHRIPNMFGAENQKDIQLYSHIVRNFLNYILQHCVCPEYTKDVMAARLICDKAEKELWSIRQLRRAFPGDFNMAASTLYGGRFQGLHISSAPWAQDDENFEDFVEAQHGLSVPEAERIFKTAIALAGNEDMFDGAMGGEVQIVKTETKAYEVVEVIQPSQETKEEYVEVKIVDGEAGYIKPLGVLRLKHWEGPGLDEEDFTDDEGEGIKSETDEVIESFWLESEVLDLCFLGMKVELTVHELNIGIRFFDTIVGLYCSFHTVLPNEKMVYWKEPVPNTRPPPTVGDPEVEERAMEAIMEGELEDDEKEFGGKKCGKK